MHKPLRNSFYLRLKKKDTVDTFREFQTEFFLILILLATTSCLIYFLVHDVISGRENIIDYSTFLLMGSVISPTGLKVAKSLTMLGSGDFLVPAYIFIIIYLERRKYRVLVYMVSATAVSSLFLGWLLKWIFHRSRPLEHFVSGAGGYSFPSGHALGGFIFSGIVVYLVWKSSYNYYIKWLISAFVILIGFCVGISRIYLHVHYATDVLGSFLVAVWWLSFIYILFRFLFKHKISKKERPDIVYFQNEYYLNN
jgi:undecaprenyl-diphosphatase